jgi:uracil-DNA glycosylase
MGQAAAEWALGRGAELSAVRGHLHQFGPWPLLPTFHPAVAIRVGRTGGPAALLEQDIRYAAELLPRLRTLRAATGAPC